MAYWNKLASTACHLEIQWRLCFYFFLLQRKITLIYGIIKHSKTIFTLEIHIYKRITKVFHNHSSKCSDTDDNQHNIIDIRKIKKQRIKCIITTITPNF